MASVLLVSVNFVVAAASTAVAMRLHTNRRLKAFPNTLFVGTLDCAALLLWAAALYAFVGCKDSVIAGALRQRHPTVFCKIQSACALAVPAPLLCFACGFCACERMFRAAAHARDLCECVRALPPSYSH
jgi:hypothetical protein